MSRSQGFQTERHEVSFEDLPAAADGLRVVHLSDLHLRGFRPRHQRLIEVVNGREPDLIAVTGDMVTPDSRSIDTCRRILGALRSRLGIFAVYGNWEHKHGLAGEPLASALAGAGVRLLVNEATGVGAGDARIFIAGVDDVLRGRPDFAAALAAAPPGAFTILMAHAPVAARIHEAWMRTQHRDDQPAVRLILSGHTHGGQVRIPLLWKCFLPRGCHRYYAGRYRVGRAVLYVSRGFASVGAIPLRFRSPPEIAVLTLRRRAGAE